MKTLLAIVFCLFSLSVQAEEKPLFLDVTITSHHNTDTYNDNGARREFNSENFGLGLTYGYSKHTELRVGFYKNSYHNTSLYGGINFKTEYKFNDFTVKPGIMIAAVTGYANEPSGLYSIGGVTPMLIPNIGISYKRFGVVVGGGFSVVGIQLQYSLR